MDPALPSDGARQDVSDRKVALEVLMRQVREEGRLPLFLFTPVVVATSDDGRGELATEPESRAGGGQQRGGEGRRKLPGLHTEPHCVGLFKNEEGGKQLSTPKKHDWVVGSMSSTLFTIRAVNFSMSVLLDEDH